ncbi:MAG: glycosyltransferase 87 family protein, partial [Chloroflexota bacterium]
FRFWVARQEVVLLGCAWLCYRTAATRERGVCLAALWLAYTPYYLEIYLGQFSVVQAALILVALLAAKRPAWRLRGDVAWAASLLWKQNTGLWLPVYLRLRRWRALAATGAAVALFSLPYFAAMPGSLSAFLGNFAAGPPDHQLGNLGARQLLYSISSALWPRLPPAGHQVVQQVWLVVVLAISLWATFRPSPVDAVGLLCLWLAAYFSIYHHVWEHHYVLLLPVWAVLLGRHPSRYLVVLYVLVACWTPYILLDPRGWAAYHAPMRWTPLEPRVLDVLYHASKALPAVLLWLHLVVQALRLPREAHS